MSLQIFTRQQHNTDDLFHAVYVTKCISLGQPTGYTFCNSHNNITVWVTAGGGIKFSIAAGLIKLHMRGVK